MDLIIGGATNYSWNDLQYWVNSIKKSGFEGDVVLVGTNMNKQTIDKLTSLGVQLSLYGKQNENGDVEAQSGIPPHVERFFYIWDYLEKTEKIYHNIIVTDTRDVIFQTNPSTWLENNLTLHELVAASEGLRYKNEPWGNSNLFQSFGSYFHNRLKEKYIYNVGVIAGSHHYVKSLMLMIFQLSLGRPIKIVDQAVYNFILDLPIINPNVYFTDGSGSWAVNLGTTLEAVKAGSGDLGKYAANDPVAMKEYMMNFEDVQPRILEDGTVVNDKGIKFAIVHQWDRVPALKEKYQGSENTIVYSSV